MGLLRNQGTHSMRCIVIVPVAFISLLILNNPVFSLPPPSPPPTTPVSPTGGGIVCGSSGSIRFLASTGRYSPLVKSWATAFSNICPMTNPLTTFEATDIAAAEQFCVASSGLAADLYFLGHPLDSNKSIPPYEINYECIGNKNKTAIKQTAIQIPVAVDATVLATGLGGFAARCIASLPGGGLTRDQLRWIFSNYTLDELKNSGWSSRAVPNSDDLDSTHLWSELCQADSNCSGSCPAREIGLVGPPDRLDVVSFLLSKVLTDASHGEGLASNRYTVTDETLVMLQVGNYPQVLGVVGFAWLNRSIGVAASVQSTKDLNYYAPCKGTLQNGLYPLARYIYMDVTSKNATQLADLRPFVKFLFSSTGDSIVTKNGLVPLSNIDKVNSHAHLGGSSRRLVNHRHLTSVVCGPPGTITATGDPLAFDMAANFANSYSSFCNLSIVNVTKSDNNFAAAKVCGNLAKGGTVDIALMTRNLNSSEAVLQANGFSYRCVKDPYHRQVNEIILATVSANFRYKDFNDGVASNCIKSLGGGLTLDQLRWIFSSFTRAQLVASGWSTLSVPNIDDDDNTHLWSELGGPRCIAKEIRIAGPPESSRAFALFKKIVLTGSGETIALNRPNGYFTGQDPFCPNGYPQGNPDAVTDYINLNSDAIGLFDSTVDLSSFLNFDVTSRVLVEDLSVPAGIKNADGDVVYPNASTLADCSYLACTPIYGYVNHEYFSFLKSSPWLTFGYTPFGDAAVAAAGLNPISAKMKSDYLSHRLKVVEPKCFSEAATVQVRGKGVIPIKQLVIGDMVMDAMGDYTMVYSWAHHDPAAEAEFVQIHALGIEQPLEITSHHMLFVGGRAVPASTVAIGDSMSVAVGGSAAKVQNISRIVRRGAYAPFTISGTVAVNSISASVYVDLQQGSGVLTIGGRDTPVTMQFLAHMFQAPRRLLCQMSLRVCQNETYDENGISTWLAAQLGAAEWLLKQHAVVMIAVLAPAILSGFVVYAIEVILLNRVLLLVAIASWFFYRNLPKARKLCSVQSQSY